MPNQKNIYKKLFNIQKEIGTISKNSENPFFKSKYFDINKLIETLKPLLIKEKLIILQPLSNKNDKAILKTIIIDSETRKKIEYSTVLPNNDDPQKMGSIITYFRRYSLQSMLFLQAEDNDANLASTSQYPKCFSCYTKSKNTSKTIAPDGTEVNPNEPPF